MRVLQGLRLNTLRLMPCLMGTKTPHLTPSPLKTLHLPLSLMSFSMPLN